MAPSPASCNPHLNLNIVSVAQQQWPRALGDGRTRRKCQQRDLKAETLGEQTLTVASSLGGHEQRRSCTVRVLSHIGGNVLQHHTNHSKVGGKPKSMLPSIFRFREQRVSKTSAGHLRGTASEWPMGQWPLGSDRGTLCGILPCCETDPIARPQLHLGRRQGVGQLSTARTGGMAS